MILQMAGKICFIVGKSLNCIFGFMYNKSCGENIHNPVKFPISSFHSFFKILLILLFLLAMTLTGFCQVIKMRAFMGVTCSFQAE
jgi:DMSO/TMAO reductase YedYZ heme-binding membrane subunit